MPKSGRIKELRGVGIVLVTVWALSACAALDPAARAEKEKNLRNFALAICFNGYFKKREWDATDIRGVAGGYFEMGDSSLETYTKISEAVHGWRPGISTKHELDIDLVKCFHLDENEELEALIKEAAGD